MTLAESRKGFTLIELLVVIAIIAILAAILFPVFASARERAKTASCMNSIKQIAIAHAMYMDNNNDTLVPVGLIGGGLNGKIYKVDGHAYWPDLLSKYTTGTGKIHKCPSTKLFGIGMNHPNLGVWTYANVPSSQMVKVSSIRHPGKTVCFADTALIANPTAEPDDWTEKPASALAAGDFPLSIVFRTPSNDDPALGGQNYYSDPASATRVVGRHGGLANCAFVDGHCSAMLPSKLGFKLQSGWNAGDYHDPGVMWDIY